MSSAVWIPPDGPQEDGGFTHLHGQPVGAGGAGALHTRVAAEAQDSGGSHHPGSQPVLAASPRDIFPVSQVSQRVGETLLRRLLR